MSGPAVKATARPGGDGTDPSEKVHSYIAREAASLRSPGGRLEGYEELVGELWDRLASDPEGRDTTPGGDGALKAPSERPPATPRQAGAQAARRVASGVGRRSRKVLGPALRSAERRTRVVTGTALEALATRGQAAADRRRRVSAGASVPARAVRLAARTATLEALPPRRRRDLPSEVRDWVVEALAASPGVVLHAECGDGALLGQLAAAGLRAIGAEPTAAGREKIRRALDRTCNGAPPVLKAGAIEQLGRLARGELGGVVLSGFTEDLRPGTARAVAHLVSTRLCSGGSAVIVSADPGTAASEDPVRADLAAGRALHAVTWGHLLSRYGLVGVTVRNFGSSGLYALTARRP